jgi:SAM-dependent methyltransferase
MKKEYRDAYHSVEERGWWFLGRRNLILELMKSFPRNSRILDIGCSGGVLIESLIGAGYKNVYGIDASSHSIDVCISRGIVNVLVEDASETTFTEKSFDVLLCSDVLEHIRDDEKAVREWSRILKDNGTVICFVPAFNFLWTAHDTMNMHYRRYTETSLRDVFQGNGFHITRSSYWNTLLFPFFLALKLLIKDVGYKKSFLSAGLIGSILRQVLFLENWLILRGIRFPFGVSVFVKSKKRAI